MIQQISTCGTLIRNKFDARFDAVVSKEIKTREIRWKAGTILARFISRGHGVFGQQDETTVDVGVVVRRWREVNER